MADLSPQDRLRQLALQVLVEQSEGWKYAVAVALEQLTHYEAQTMGRWDAAYRLDALARKHALVDYIQHIYTLAEVESPLIQHHAALVAALKPQAQAPAPVLDHGGTTAQDRDAAVNEYLRTRRASGSVA